MTSRWSEDIRCGYYRTYLNDLLEPATKRHELEAHIIRYLSIPALNATLAFPKMIHTTSAITNNLNFNVFPTWASQGFLNEDLS